MRCYEHWITSVMSARNFKCVVHTNSLRVVVLKPSTPPSTPLPSSYTTTARALFQDPRKSYSLYVLREKLFCAENKSAVIKGNKWDFTPFRKTTLEGNTNWGTVSIRTWQTRCKLPGAIVVTRQRFLFYFFPLNVIFHPFKINYA